MSNYKPSGKMLGIIFGGFIGILLLCMLLNFIF